jgi:hypothetical protein
MGHAAPQGGRGGGEATWGQPSRDKGSRGREQEIANASSGRESKPRNQAKEGETQRGRRRAAGIRGKKEAQESTESCKADSVSANMLDEGKLRHKGHNNRGISRRGREGVQKGRPAGQEGVEGCGAVRRGTETEVMKKSEPAGTPRGDRTP